MIRAPQATLTLDDLERIAFTYGGTVERDVVTNTYRLVGTTMAGQTFDLGPVAA